jgi:hypothetical protein
MYFVTTNRAGFILFSMTPSERAAIGLSEKHIVHLLVRPTTADEWTVLHTWKAADYSPTDFMAALHYRDEPADPAQLLDLLPSNLRP